MRHKANVIDYIYISCLPYEEVASRYTIYSNNVMLEEDSNRTLLEEERSSWAENETKTGSTVQVV